jgi:hypothetical protein
MGMKVTTPVLNLAVLVVLILRAESADAQLMHHGSRSGNTFAATTPVMNTARDDATATLLRNGKVLIAGGTNDGSTSLSSTELYDPASNKFSGTPPVMNVARVGATATLLPGGKVLIAGGYGRTDILNSTELYDPATNTFASSAATPVMNTAREQATATLLSNGKVLIAGGDGNSYPYSLDSVELYDPATNTFAASIATPVMNTARYFATATLLRNGEVLIAGGTNDGGSGLSSTELYDSTTNTFGPSATTPVMNNPREYATATLLRDGKVLIAGGEVAFEDVLDTNELYDPATNSFEDSTPVMNAARDLATATALRDGKVLIAGGESIVGAPPNLTILPSTELYSPAKAR